MNLPLITLMILAPLLGALIQTLNPKISSWVSLFASVASGAIGLFAVAVLSGHPGQALFRESLDWLRPFQISYEVALDGLSAPMLVLVSLVFPFVIVSEWRRTSSRRGVFGLYLLLQSMFVGIVCARDLFFLFSAWAFTAFIFYLLLTLTGESKELGKSGESGTEAAFQYLITSTMGDALFFCALLLIYFSVEPHSLQLSALTSSQLQTDRFEILGRWIATAPTTFFLMVFGLMFRIPIWPVNGWFTRVMSVGTSSFVVVLCGVFVPLGYYLFLRLGFTIFPAALREASVWFLVLGGLNAVAGALGAIAQSSLRRMMAYLSLMQGGALLLGITSFQTAGIVGAVFQLLSIGLGFAAFGLLVGALLSRGQSDDVTDADGKPVLGGLAARTPLLTAAAALIIGTMVGVPGLSGFVGQSLIVMGAAQVHPWLMGLFCVVGLLATIGLVRAFRFLFLGPERPLTEKWPDLTLRERIFLYPVALASIFFGLYPKPLMDVVRSSVIELLTPGS